MFFIYGGKNSFVLLWAVCFGLVLTSESQAKVCFVGDPDCAQGAEFEEYTDPYENGESCESEGYVLKSECDSDASKHITGYCPYNSNYVMCCGKEYSYDLCSYPLVSDGKCGTKHKCVCDYSKFPFNDKYQETSCERQYPGAIADGGSCVQSGYDPASGGTLTDSYFSECVCNPAIYRYVKEDCTNGTEPSDDGCTGTDGTSLSYESWIMVRGMTRASFDNRVSVTLNNEFANVDSIIRVNTFELGDMRTALVYETAGNRQEDFVTVTDSVLVYKVMFNEFEFSYDLYHEIAVYDDGVTRQTMPYHPIRNVRDNGYEVEDLDFVTEDNGEGGKIVYLRKLLKHSIAVDFNGETYTVYAKIELRRCLGNAPCIVESEILDEGKDILQSGIFGALSEVYYQSWIKVRQVWSDGNVTEETYTNDCAVYIELNSEAKKYKILPDANIVRKEASVVSGETEESAMGSSTEYISSYITRKSYVITYNYFTLTYEFQDMVPVYDDNVTRYEMPHYSFSGFSDKFRLSSPVDDTVEGRPAWGYIFFSEVTFGFGDASSSFEENISVYVYKEP